VRFQKTILINKKISKILKDFIGLYLLFNFKTFLNNFLQSEFSDLDFDRFIVEIFKISKIFMEF
jgi:hypothetical protein